MKRLSALLICLQVLTLYAQKGDTLQKYLDQKLRFSSKSKAFFPAVGIRTENGWFLKAMYPDTTVLIIAYFKDKNFTIKNGPYRLYHEKNILAMEGTFVNDVAQGPWKYYYPNRRLKDSGTLVNNFMTGTWRSYDEKGNLQVAVSYKNNPAGKSMKQPRSESTILPAVSPYPGERDGLSTSYFPTGRLKDSIFYKDDKREGKTSSWYADGKPDAIGSFRNDSLDGNWTYYRDNGNKSTEEVYRGGKLQSMTCFDSAGNNAGSFCSILKPPVPLGDFDDFNEYMLDNIFWPKTLDPDIEGVVKVEFIVTKKGEITNFAITASPHQLLSDEVTRFFSSIESWSPAISHNRIVDFPMKIEVPFVR